MNQKTAKAPAFRPTARLTVLVAALFSLVLSACSTAPATSADALRAMCSEPDLGKHKQRALLAGGYRALEQHDLACAERLTGKARELDPKDPWAALNLGAIYQRTKRPEQARAEYEQAIRLDAVESTAETSTEATRDLGKKRRPADIARSNLALMSR